MKYGKQTLDSYVLLSSVCQAQSIVDSYKKTCILVHLSQRCPAWGDFGPYTECSATCGGGVRIRSRVCNFPGPGPDGGCPGVDQEFDSCNTEVSDVCASVKVC